MRTPGGLEVVAQAHMFERVSSSQMRHQPRQAVRDVLIQLHSSISTMVSLEQRLAGCRACRLCRRLTRYAWLAVSRRLQAPAERLCMLPS